ncbi:DegT/DnrJ/EryC1/StrS aminotransferase [Pseudoalteromonas sp. BMB]|uniref:DegT/DnrJ/EryC1/StrS family aminotransferase n=1 Tax=Pseudoalteromonas sp. BMB TaxID=1874619 RepID=UPI00083D364B|nr:DegT/DnrJ/EryC1/StrS family aminotransferase [Pseudoalteromonas sp. BMB]ODB36790.1 DegT/DnrJ/EryC1/StrS aminotransferase [Pseudoalteromonas sp. BMB]
MKYPIVKPYLPKLETYQKRIADIYDSGWVTNNGPCVQELEQALADYLDVEHVLLVANGTLALNIAYQALGISGTVLTTPYSFAATASSLITHGASPEFIDIDGKTLNIDITTATERQLQSASAVVAVHVYGNPCDDAQLQRIAEQYNLKVVYDAAHTFGVNYQDKSLLAYGDAATVSFHATKIFHTIEGGAVIFKHKKDYLKAKEIINFGFNKQQFPDCVGTNAKMSEMHAAMGLSLLPQFEEIKVHRQSLYQHYEAALSDMVDTIEWMPSSLPNGSYFPIFLQNEAELLSLVDVLTQSGIQSRRYFYPSLNEVPAYGMKGNTPIANDISRRALCLPMYTELTKQGVDDIASVVIEHLKEIRKAK